jgi:hypothetical protein
MVEVDKTAAYRKLNSHESIFYEVPIIIAETDLYLLRIFANRYYSKAGQDFQKFVYRRQAK